MFRHQWRERTTQSVTIGHFDYETIRAMIEYIYYGGGDEQDNDPVELYIYEYVWNFPIDF